MDARGFLKNNGLTELINIVVEDNKFETLSDLTLLANNQRFLDSLKVPVCWQIKFVNAISKLEQKDDSIICESTPLKPGESPVSMSTSSSAGDREVVSPAEGEISKKRLVTLAKTNMTAQAVNLKYNDLNKVLLAEIRRAETKWQGAGGLKRCDSTDGEDAQTNMNVADEIVDSPSVTKFYGSYEIGEHGTFVINRAKAKLLLGRKLSQQRKPSAYKRKLVLSNCENSLDTTKKAKEVATSQEVDKGRKEKKAKEVATSKEVDKGRKEKGKENVTDAENETVEAEDVSQYEKQRLARMEQNKLQMLKHDILPQSMGVLAALFYLKARKLSQVHMLKIKKEVTALGVKFDKGKTPTKEHLTFVLGKELLSQGKLKRKDLDKPISRDNLILNI